MISEKNETLRKADEGRKGEAGKGEMKMPRQNQALRQTGKINDVAFFFYKLKTAEEMKNKEKNKTL